MSDILKKNDNSSEKEKTFESANEDIKTKTAEQSVSSSSADMHKTLQCTDDFATTTLEESNYTATSDTLQSKSDFDTTALETDDFFSSSNSFDTLQSKDDFATTTLEADSASPVNTYKSNMNFTPTGLPDDFATTDLESEQAGYTNKPIPEVQTLKKTTAEKPNESNPYYASTPANNNDSFDTYTGSASKEEHESINKKHTLKIILLCAGSIIILAFIFLLIFSFFAGYSAKNDNNSAVVETSAEETKEPAESETEQTTGTEAIADDTWQSGYKAKIEELSENGDVRYNLYDIDNDNSPELFLTTGNLDSSLVMIYTFSDGEVIDLSGEEGGFGAQGCIKISSDSTEMVSEVFENNEYTYTIYKKSGNKIEQTVKYLYSTVEYKYQIDDADVSSEEFTEKFNSYFAGKELILLGYDYGLKSSDLSLIDSFENNEDSLANQGEKILSSGLLIDSFEEDSQTDNTSEPTMGIINSEANVRSLPEVNSDNVIGFYPFGTVVTIDTEKSNESWYYVTGISSDGSEMSGYIGKQYVTVE